MLGQKTCISSAIHPYVLGKIWLVLMVLKWEWQLAMNMALWLLWCCVRWKCWVKRYSWTLTIILTFVFFLEHLSGNNNLIGTIPDELAALSSVSTIDLALNPLLSGQIPSSLLGLADLADFRAFSCNLAGTLPENIGNLKALTNLALQSNDIGGSIPPSIGQLTSLQNLFLSNNQLSSNIPSEMGSLVDLQILELNRNPITGSIPAELSNLVELRHADFSFTDLTEGPENLCSLERLTVYSADCYSRQMPKIEQEVDCPCCTLCCSEHVDACFENEDINNNTW